MKTTFKWVGGATWILDIAGLRIACDPVLCPSGTVQDYFWFKSRRLNNPVYCPRDFADIDLWLITHAHQDHLDDWGLRQINQRARIISHKNAVKKLEAVTATEVQILHWGETEPFRCKGLSITIEAMPAIHGVNPASALLAGGVNGYWISIKSENEALSVYVTGDTVTHNKVVRSFTGRTADFLIPNMGAAKKGSFIGTLTLSANMLREITSTVRPRITIPVHFGTFEHYIEPVDNIAALKDETIKILQPGQTYTATM